MLTIDQLGFRYRRRFLFRQLSFEVEKGQLWHIKGPNGCGKSTLMALLTHKLVPTEGGVVFNDESISYQHQFEYLGAEQNALFGDLSALDNLRFWLQWKSAPADEALGAELRAWGFRHRLAIEEFPVATFSTGMKRKLALARVVLSGAPLWLLDEPLYGLDESALSVFRDRLSRHCEAGGAAVTVSHDAAAFSSCQPQVIDLSGYVPSRPAALGDKGRR